MNKPSPILRLLAYGVAILVTVFFLYPYWWMLLGAFRSTQSMLTNPLALWPESISFKAFSEIARLGGQPLWIYVANSLFITLASTVIGVLVTALGAYALVRKPHLLPLQMLRNGFLITIMYPYMLLVIPAYIVIFKIGLLGSYTGIILFLSLGPIQFFLFEQFFRRVPGEIIEAALLDGVSELRIFWYIILPISMPVVATTTIITFLLNWAQWFPVLVVSRSPETYTLPVALLNMNGELGVNFQGIMALAVLTTLPATFVFLIAQKRVMQGMTDGALKG